MTRFMRAKRERKKHEVRAKEEPRGAGLVGGIFGQHGWELGGTFGRDSDVTA
ncbi:unnamed protein product [Dovyalis caffra]|uniref:Uncharacterized protein n=1 Tax=Dovyalis caffra TaxID=77055 RepID=A0AAV1QTD6_9ROSI|nr:unnamed protein product [Dovyalis caffra]